MEGKNRCVKYLLVLSNFFFFLAGIALCAVGIFIAVDKLFIADIIGSTLYSSASYLLIASGVIIIVISIFGCCGAGRENRCILVVYFVCLLLMFIFLTVAAILAVVFRGELGTTMKNEMKKTLVDNYNYITEVNEKNRAITTSWDATQSRLNCCAVDTYGWEIYKESQWFKLTQTADVKNAVPKTCCIWVSVIQDYKNLEHCQKWQLGPPNRMEGGQNDALIYKGCYDSVYDFVIDQTGILLAMGFSFATLLILGLVLSILLYRAIPEDETNRRRTPVH